MPDKDTRDDIVYQRTRRFFQHMPELRGAFALNNELTRWSYLALQSIGRRPGVDFQLVGFDNPMLAGVPFICQDVQQMVSEAVSILIRLIEGQRTTERRVIRPDFIMMPTGEIPRRLVPYLVSNG
jgi:DNA-binding LacI/PurR family transcriptional regulator